MPYPDLDPKELAETCALWPLATKQQGKALPFLLERYLNGRQYNGVGQGESTTNSLKYLALVTAQLAAVCLHQEERINALEASLMSAGVALLERKREDL